MAGDNSTATTGMADEEVPVVLEISVFMGRQEPPNGYVVYRYANGSDYSGYMLEGVPHGYGILRGRILTYAGEWEWGVFAEGIMIDAVRGLQFGIPRAPQSPQYQGPHGRQESAVQ